MAQEEAKEEDENFLEIQEKELESKFTLDIVPPSVSQIHSCTLHSRNLEVEVNITKQALFSFLMSKIRVEALYGMFSLSACHTLFGGSWLFDYGVSCKGHDQGQALTFALLPPPHKCDPRDVRKSSS